MKSFFSKTRLFVGIVLSLTICMMFVGCSNSTSAPASEARGFTDFEHIEKEYLATIEKLNWPDGVTLPDKLEGEDTGTSFQVGYGDTRASNLWEYEADTGMARTQRFFNYGKCICPFGLQFQAVIG